MRTFLSCLTCVILLSGMYPSTLSAQEGSGLPVEERSPVYPVNLADDFTQNRLVDASRYVRFGPSYFKVTDGVLRAKWQENRWHLMEMLNIFPCFGKNSRLTFDLRWAGGEGGNLLVVTDFRYRMVGRRTHVYFNLNEQKVVLWNTDGYDTKTIRVRKNEWLQVKIERLADRILVFINNSKIIEKNLDKLDPIHNEQQEAGYNHRGVVYQAANNTHLQGLNTHELAHCWANYYGKKWSIEGSADFCHFAYYERTQQRLMQATDFLFNSERFSKEEMLTATRNYYLEDDEYIQGFFKAGMPDFDTINKIAWKQRVFVYLLYRLLGPEGFRALHRQALALGHGMSSEEMLTFASNIAGRDMGPYFKGWVFPGKGRLPAETVFTDDDEDGLVNLDEHLFGTDPAKTDTDNDGYGDRGEIAFGSNPLSSRDPPYKAIVIDGLFGDWEKIKIAGRDIQDAKGGEDMKSVQFVLDQKNRLLFGRVTFWQPAPIASTQEGNSYYLTIDFETGQDNFFDYRLNIFFINKNRVNAFRTNGYTGEKWDPAQWTGLHCEGVEFRYTGQELEFMLPFTVIDLPPACSLYLNSGTPAGTDWFDKAPLTLSGETQWLSRPQQIWQKLP